MTQRGKVVIIQGAQYGSEGKGMISAMEGSDHSYMSAIRTGGPNSGHTVVKNGKHIVMNQIPTPWATNDHCKLILGPGAIINPEILLKEIKILEKYGIDVQTRLYIHPNAAIILQDDRHQSSQSGRYYSLGGTSEGSSSAVCRRIMRDVDGNTPATVGQYCGIKSGQWISQYINDTTSLVEDDLASGGNVIIEGTQGCHLDMLLSQYPYTTHRACNTSALLAEAGIAPNNKIEVGLVIRTYPIRVAGNSGYMPNELSWLDMLEKFEVSPNVTNAYEKAIIGRLKDFGAPLEPRINLWSDEEKKIHRECLRVVMTKALNDIDYRELDVVERTSVTNLVRRIAYFDLGVLDRSRIWSGCDWLAITFTNYVDNEVKNLEDLKSSAKFFHWFEPVRKWCSMNDAYVRWVNTGPRVEDHYKLESSLMELTPV